jgi:hypothetical protein
MTAPTPSELEALARGLTKAQREVIMQPGGYHDPNTIQSLRRKGLFGRMTLTDAGEILKAHLQDTSHGN